MVDRRHFLWQVAGCGLALMATGTLEAAQTTHTVRRGDTLSGLAQRYGTSVKALKKANGLRSDLIIIGQKLVIPVQQVHRGDMGRIMSGVAVRPGRWTTIVGHHSATQYGNAEIYDKNHRRRGMTNGLAYHFVIGNGVDSGDGVIEVGPRWRKQQHGGHVRSNAINQVGIGICVVGNFEETRPSSRQMASFRQLVRFLGEDVMGGKFRFAVHKEIDRNHTVCPGRNFPVAALHREFG